MAGEDFATTGTESFDLGKGKPKKDEVIVNIQDDKNEGIILEKSKAKGNEYTGNFFLDTYSKINRFFVQHSSVKPQAKSQFFHLLAVMVNAGIPMVKALNSLAMQTDKSPRLKYVVEDLAYGIENGGSLSEVMSSYSDVFTDQEIGMVKAGEASGQLAKVLDNLSDETEKVYKIRSKVKSAMMYPVVIIILLVVVIGAMMIYVVPKLKELFSSMGEDLPLLTRVILAISDFMVGNKLLLGLGILGLILFFMAFKRTATGRYMVDKLKLKLPIFGKLFKKAYLARFSSALSNLMDSNVTILKTLEISANSVGNEVYRQRLLLSMEDIKQGISLAENLTESDLFPPMMVNMIEVGEKTAQMPEITAKVSAFYENEVDTAVAGIAKIIEPVVLMIIGGTVGVVVAAIMLPIVKLSDFAGSM